MCQTVISIPRGIQNMVMLKSIAYITGITIAIMIFGLILFSFISGMVEQTEYIEMTEEEFMERVAEHPAYAAMYERFPDAVEEVNLGKRGGEVSVGHINMDTGNSLVLKMSYYASNSHLDGQIRCNVQNPDYHVQDMYQDLLFAASFIKSTTCLDD